MILFAMIYRGNKFQYCPALRIMLYMHLLKGCCYIQKAVATLKTLAYMHARNAHIQTYRHTHTQTQTHT